jgi:GrpB-like predicted nucleotidyltransferase (UPF0157 family)
MTTPAHDHLVIVAYDPRWPAHYEQERAALLTALGHRMLGIEHVGSTSVSGLAAKPIIDILIGLPRLEDADECAGVLATLGYRFVSEALAYLPDDRYFRRLVNSAERVIEEFHLHATAYASAFWRDRIRFRDLLRSSPLLADEYLDLKRELARRYTSGPDYSVAKTDFIHRTLSRASELPRGTGPPAD